MTVGFRKTPQARLLRNCIEQEGREEGQKYKCKFPYQVFKITSAHQQSKGSGTGRRWSLAGVDSLAHGRRTDRQTLQATNCWACHLVALSSDSQLHPCAASSDRGDAGTSINTDVPTVNPHTVGSPSYTHEIELGTWSSNVVGRCASEWGASLPRCEAQQMG